MPETQVADQLHGEKYRGVGESFREFANRFANAVKEDEKHFHEVRDIVLEQRFLPAGRVQAAMGSPKIVTAFNCFVGPTLDDSFVDGPNSIMNAATMMAQTMRMGGGVGHDFSTLRPRGTRIKSLDSGSSGPVGFMPIYDAIGHATSSAGNRRGAQMGVLRVDHPDVEEFVRAKQNSDRLTGFNVSVAVTDAFMQAMQYERSFTLQWGGQEYKVVDPRLLWEEIMRSTWDWAEPGVLFIDRMNEMNNLWYAETIFATNPSMPAGTMIHTSMGIGPIESFEGKKFRVKSLNGEWADAECFLSSESARIIEIDFGGMRTVRCTPEHRWPVLLNGRYVKVDAGDLRPGDMIPANRNERLGHEVDSSLTYEDGLLAGLAFGDGSYGVRKDDGRAYLSFHNNLLDRELAEIEEKYFGSSPRPQSDELVVNVTQDQKVRDFVKKVGLTFNEKLKIPSTVWASNDDFVAGFVDGMFSSDGSVDVKNGRINFCNKNEDVVKEVAWLLSFHGILGGFRTCTTRLKGKVYSRTDYVMGINSAKRFANLFRLSCKRKQKQLSILTGLHARKNIASSHLEIKKVTNVGRGRVWDISVYHDQHVFPTIWGYTGNCGEQCLPPHGACLLGSFNLVKYLDMTTRTVDLSRLKEDVPAVVRAMDNVIDRTIYPLPEQEVEAKNKRRMGIGVTGVANALEVIGLPYGSPEFLGCLNQIVRTLTNALYRASAELAREKGAFPLFDREDYLDGRFVQRIDGDVKDAIAQHGIRNSHLTSIAPTGTISLCADNVSASIEPVYQHETTRRVRTAEGEVEMALVDWAYRVHGVRGKTARECSIAEHLAVQEVAQHWTDSSVSKTINVDPATPWDTFKATYTEAFRKKLKGVTTFNPEGKRRGIFIEQGEACRIDEETGQRSCDV